MYGMKKDELWVAPHDPTWRDAFATEQRRIANALRDPTIQIEHVGSTAIPMVHAKPILDIAILCGESGIEAVAQTLIELSYDYRGQSGSPGCLSGQRPSGNGRLDH
jgi:GrpB-like predicted nucleotidyltransferase (UPF0157 family)